MQRATIMLVMLFTGAFTGTLAAQGPSRMPPGWAVGGSVQRVSLAEWATPVVTLRATKLPELGAGADFAFSVFPAGFERGTLVFMTDVGVVAPARFSSVSIFARVGASVLAAVGRDGGGGAFNAYVGAGTILQIAPSIGLRFDVERRFVPGVDPRYGFFVIGMGITSIPRDRKPEG
jgi:hypothetical protein